MTRTEREERHLARLDPEQSRDSVTLPHVAMEPSLFNVGGDDPITFDLIPTDYLGSEAVAGLIHAVRDRPRGAVRVWLLPGSQPANVVLSLQSVRLVRADYSNEWTVW